jgi:predicted metalloprotease with PDZ domain
MCLDIIIREQSGGTRGILSVMQALAKKYGVDKPFTDNQLFNEIVAMTYPEVGDFIKTHIKGETPIPYKRFLEKAGVTIVDTDQKLPSIIMVTPRQPFIAPQPNEAGTMDLVVTGLNNRLSEIGFQAGDVLRVFNGAEIPALTQENMGALNMLFGVSFDWKLDQEVMFKVERAGVSKTLHGTVGVAVAPAKGIQANTNATAAQIALRNAWLYE